MNARKGLDHLSTGLAFLAVAPTFIIAAMFYASFFRDTTIVGAYMASIITLGVCLPPALMGLRGVFRLILFILRYY
jgi:hypothetical protein